MKSVIGSDVGVEHVMNAATIAAEKAALHAGLAAEANKEFTSLEFPKSSDMTNSRIVSGLLFCVGPKGRCGCFFVFCWGGERGTKDD